MVALAVFSCTTPCVSCPSTSSTRRSTCFSGFGLLSLPSWPLLVSEHWFYICAEVVRFLSEYLFEKLQTVFSLFKDLYLKVLESLTFFSKKWDDCVCACLSIFLNQHLSAAWKDLILLNVEAFLGPGKDFLENCLGGGGHVIHR